MGPVVRRKSGGARAPVANVRDSILDVAESRLRERGPDAIRLQDVAAEVGVSHPAILHHFGSREGLVQAVVDRALRSLQADLARALSSEPRAGDARDAGEAMFEQVFEVLFDRGHARLMAWLLLTGHDALASREVKAGWQHIAELTHTGRLAASKATPPPSYEDTRFTIVLSALALFGHAIAGKVTFEMAGFGRGAAVDKRFRAWLAGVLGEHLRGSPGSAG